VPDAGKRITLQEYVISECRDKGQNQGLESVIMAIAEGSRRVQQQVQQAALADALGVTGEINVQGEIVQRLDTVSSDIFVETLSKSGHVAVIGCEEIERPVIVEGDTAEGYIVLMDPLDGYPTSTSRSVSVRSSESGGRTLTRRSTTIPFYGQAISKSLQRTLCTVRARSWSWRLSRTSADSL